MGRRWWRRPPEKRYEMLYIYAAQIAAQTPKKYKDVPFWRPGDA